MPCLETGSDSSQFVAGRAEAGFVPVLCPRANNVITRRPRGPFFDLQTSLDFTAIGPPPMAGFLVAGGGP